MITKGDLLIRLRLRRIHLPHGGRLTTVSDAVLVRRLIVKIRLFIAGDS